MNLIGEHTDYNGGLALPTVTPLQTTVTCTTRDDDRLALHTSAPVPWASLEIEMSRLGPIHSWADHVIGIFVALGREVGPCTIEVRSDLPAGAGLGSSAALAVATLRAVRETFGLALDDSRIAEIAYQRGASCLRAGLKETEAAEEFRGPLSTAGTGFEGVLRADRITWTGHVRDTVLFAILRDEWPV